MGSTVDPILEKAPCDVVLIKDWPKGKIGRVLVPVAGGPHTALALEVSGLFAQEDEGKVTPLHVVRPGESEADGRTMVESAIEGLGLPRDLFEPKFVVSDSVRQAILDQAESHDLIVLGASQERAWQQLVMGSLPEEVARQCKKPVAMVKAQIPLRSRVRRWI